MADITAPTLLQMSPSDNATGVSVTSNLRLAFSEAVNATSGLIKIYKSDGTLFHTIAANDTTQVFFDSTKARVTIDPSVSLLAGTSYYVIIETGAFEDLAGNDYAGLSSPTALNFTTAGTGGGNPPADTTAPLLTGTTPNDNANNVDVAANLILTFNEAVKAGTGNIQIRNSSNGALVQSIAITDAAKVSFSGNQVTINPGSDLSPDTSYYVTFASGVVRDLANNAFAGIASAAVFNFTTQSDYVDTTAPIIIFTSPENYLTGNKNLTIVFNEPVRAGSGLIEIRNAADDSLYSTISVTDTSQVSFSGRDVTINPTNDLPSGSYYVVIAPTAFEDLYGHDFDASLGIGVNAVAVGTFASGNAASVVNAGTIAIASHLSVFASAFASGITATATGVGGGAWASGDLIAGNDASLDVSAMTIDTALNGTLVSVTSTRVDILGTDGLSYRIIGYNFNTAATTVAQVGGLTSYIEVWSGQGASAHILYTHYDLTLSLPQPGFYNIEETLGGHDTIIGSSDDDILYGFTGDDEISGREGNDQLNGGFGYDTFKYASLNAVNGDIIAGFEGGDKIDLSAIAGLSFIGSAGFSGIAGQARYAWSSGNTILQIDGNGDGAADVSLTLSGGQFALGETTPGSKVLVWTSDTVAPVLISKNPADNAVGVSLSENFYLTFNENIIAGAGNIEIRRSADDTVFDTIDVASSSVHFTGNVASFVPHAPFAAQTGYYITFAPGVFQDVAGNDAAGIASKSAFNFTTVDVTAPTLVDRSPSFDAMGVSPGTNIVLTFSEAVQAGSGAVQIRVYGSNALVKSISIGDTSQISFSGNQVTINPSSDLPFGEHFYVSMAPGLIKDLAGNNSLDLTGWVNFTTAPPPDTTAPTFIASSPSDNEIQVPLSADIAIVFNEQVKAGTGVIEIRRSLDGSLFESISVTDSSKVTFGAFATVNPTGNFAPGTGYYVTFGSGVFKDLAGNIAPGISSPTAINFWTAGSTDTVAPILLSTSPADNASGVGVSANLVLNFSETVAPGGGSFEIRKSLDGSSIAILGSMNPTQALFNGSTVTLNSPIDLEAGTSYYVLISGYAVQDIAGNDFVGISSPTTFNFTTAAVGGGSPPGGLTGDGFSNTLVGGAGDDIITGLGRGDTLTGGGGSDKFVYTAVSDSTSRGYDTITDFNTSADLIDLWFQVTGVDTVIASGSLSRLGLDSDLSSAVGAAKLAGHHAVLFTPTAGDLSGKKFLIVDANGVAGYQAGGDLVILLGNASSLGGLTAADFV